jgi:hypothetical protein
VSVSAVIPPVAVVTLMRQNGEMKLEVDFKPRAGQQWYATSVYRVVKCANAL